MPVTEGELPVVDDKLDWLHQFSVLSCSQNSKSHLTSDSTACS